MVGRFSARASRSSKFYYEETDSSEIDFDDDYSVERNQSTSHARRSRTARSSKRPGVEGSQQRSRISKAHPTKKKALRKPEAKANPAQLKSSSRDSTQPVPPWQTLPYHILLKIFEHLAEPEIYAGNQRPGRFIGKLPKLARLCRSFAEPALTALYARPPQLTQKQIAGLTNLVVAHENEGFNYATKIRHLRINTTEILPSYLRRKIVDILPLIKLLPRLESLDFFALHTEFAYRYAGEYIPGWKFLESLIVILENNNVRLRQWRWDLANLPLDQEPMPMLWAHSKSPFERLQTMTLSNACDPYPTGESVHSRWKTDVEIFVMAISLLKELSAIVLDTCALIPKGLLSLIPQALSSLTCINCSGLNDEEIQSFLITSGRNLRCLVLKQTPMIELSFLPLLKESCPELQELYVDLSVRSVRSANDAARSNQVGAMTETLGGAPTWPESLQKLQLFQVRSWSKDDVEMVFQSLLDSAPRLRYLRRLELGIVLNIPIRERASIRRKWVQLFEERFLRPFKDPIPQNYYASIGATHRKGLEPSHSQNMLVDRTEKNESSGSPKRHSARLSHRTSLNALQQLEGTDIVYRDNRNQNRSGQRNGLCWIVNIRIDNSMQREEHFTEKDFLDSELSGDEDWTAENDGFEENTYAW